MARRGISGVVVAGELPGLIDEPRAEFYALRVGAD
jgi:hypothetical protein